MSLRVRVESIATHIWLVLLLRDYIRHSNLAGTTLMFRLLGLLAEFFEDCEGRPHAALELFKRKWAEHSYEVRYVSNSDRERKGKEAERDLANLWQ